MTETRNRAPPAAAARQASPAEVARLPLRLSDARLLECLKDDVANAAELIHDHFSSDVHRLIWRILGPDAEHDDVVQQAFQQIFAGVHRVRDPNRLREWVIAVTVNTARSEIRRRRFWGFFSGTDRRELDESYSDDHEGRALVRRTYAVLDQMPANERMAFVLRLVEGRPIAEVARLCECSPATLHRRLSRAKRRFRKLAHLDAALAERLRVNDSEGSHGSS